MDPVPPGTPYHWLTRHAEAKPAGTALLTWRAGGISDRLDWAGLHQRAGRTCAGLAASGITATDRVILVLPNDATFAVALLACMRAGAIAVPAPLPTSGRTSAFTERLRGIVTAARAAMLVTLDEWVPQLRAAAAAGPAGCQVTGAGALQDRGALPGSGAIRDYGARATPRAERPAGDIALLQFTSGSTGRPRGVVVTYGALRANCQQAAAAYREHEDDVAVSWVPLYHDMGLVTALMRPLYSGYATVLLRPEDFVRSPGSWLTAIGECGGTLASSPNFGYELCVRKVPRPGAAALDLSRWRVARNAGEVVRAATLDRFAGHFAAAGFRREALCPSYGLAEATLTVTTCGPSAAPRWLTARRADLEAGRVTAVEAEGEPERLARTSGAGGTEAGVAAAGEPAGRNGPPEQSVRRLVSSGVPLPGTEVAIKDQARDGQVGEVMIKGPQLSPGYWQADSCIQPNRAPGADWYTTGDLGFLWEGQLFVLGRADDTLVVNGSNYFAMDIAATCAQVPGIRAGRVAAFVEDENGGQAPSVRLVAEIATGTDPSPQALSRLALNVRQTLARMSGLYLSGVDFVQPGDLPVTTSGKVRASEVRRRYAASALSLLSQEGGQ